MWVINNRRIFFGLSGFLAVLALASIFVFGLNLGIDFKGGSILEVEYSEFRPETEVVLETLEPLMIGNILVQPTGESGQILRMPEISTGLQAEILSLLTEATEQEVQEIRFSSIGPAIGAELANKGLIAIALVVVLIIGFLAFAFSGSSKQMSSWRYGVVAIITLIHDILLPVGLFAFLGWLVGFEMDALFLTALLAILGLSVNDTIVVFDRIRENSVLFPKKSFTDITGESLSQTYIRSINTSVTTIVVLLSLWLLGGETTKNFALVLAVGMALGTYSSIFLAAPLLAEWSERSKNKKQA
ncbi:MAG: protein translocase subunit SecF [Patescibacteria group bacterium]